MLISNNLFSLESKTALVTGGSPGLGRMATAGLAAAGAKVFIVSRNLENCEKLEQLRLIDSGYKYETFLTKGQHLSIDTEKQYLEAKKLMDQ